MSKVVEERIVQMQFDNSNFEKNVKTSMSSLDKLKDQFKNLSHIDFSPLKNALGKNTESIDQVTESTGLLTKAWGYFKDTVAIAGLQEMYRIATQVRNVVESLSFGNIFSGYAKMTDTVTSTATLVSQGYALEEVNDQLERLLWFTDETSYNFTDMVSNISKFTAAGQDLPNAMTAMEGIATWAALSGQNARIASSAMYQLSQAMGSYVKREDWRSIQNYNMDTTEFRQTALDTAVAMGKLKKVSDDTYSYVDKTSTKSKEVNFNIKQFVDSLTEGAWLTADVLVETLKKYGGASDQLRDAQEAFEEYSGTYLTASEIIKAAQANLDKSNPEKWDEVVKSFDLSNDEATKLKELTSNIDEFGIKAFLAAQEARSFSDALGATKDAVSTKWMQIFQDIFGDYEQQRKLWTDLANDLYTIFAEPYEYVLEVLDRWHQNGGYDSLVSGFSNIMKSFIEILDAFRSGIRKALGLDTEKGLDNASNLLIKIAEGFEKITKVLMPSKKTLDLISKSAEFLTNIFVWFYKIIKGIVEGPGSLIVKIFKSLGNEISELLDKMNGSAKIASIIEKINTWVERLTESTKKLTEKIKDFLDKTSIIKTVANTLNTALKTARTIANVIVDTVRTFTKTSSGELNSALTILDLTTIITTLNSVKNFIGGIKDTFIEGKGLFKNIDSIINSVNGALKKLGNALDSFSKSLDTSNLVKAALTLIGLAAALKILSAIDVDKIIPSLIAMGVLIKMLPSVFNAINNSLKSINKMKFTNVLKQIVYLRSIVLSFVILAAAIKILSTISWKKLWPALTAMGLVIAAFVGVVELLGHSKINNRSLKSLNKLLTISLAMLPMAIALKMLSKIGWKKLWPALTAFGIVIGAFVGVVEILGHTKLKISSKTTAMILALALSMIPIASALKSLSEIKDWDGIWRALVSFGGVMLIMTGTLALIGKMKKSVASFKSSMALILAVSAGIYVISMAFNNISDLKWGQILRGLAAFGGVMLAVGVALKIMSKTSKYTKGGFSLTLKDGLKKDSSTKSSSSPAGGLLAAAISIYVIAKAFQEIAIFDWKQLISAVGAITAFLLAYTGISALLAKIQKKSGDSNAIIKISAGMLLFALAIKSFSSSMEDLKYTKLEDMVRSFGALVAMLTPLAAMTAIFKNMAPAMLMVAGAILAYAVATNLLNAASIESAANASLMQATAVAVAEAEWTKFEVKWKKLKAFLPNILGLIKDAALSIIQFLPDIIVAIGDAIIKAAPSIVDTLEKMLPYLVDVILKLLIQLIDQLTEKVPELLSSLGKLLSAIFAGIKDAVNNGTIEKLAKVGLGLTAFLGSLALLKHLGKAAMVGVLYFGACMAELSAVLSVLGLIDKIPGVENLIEGGGNLLEKIGTAIGKFVGGLLGGVTSGFTSQLPDIGTDLSNFMKNLGPFIEGCKDIDSELVKKVSSLALAIIELGAAEFINTLNKISSLGLNSLGKLGDDLTKFLENVIPGMKAVGEVDSTIVTSVTKFIASVGKLSEIDYKSFRDVSASLTSLGTNISAFATSVSEITENDVAQIELASKILTIISDVAKQLPNSGGIFGAIVGNNDIGDFGEQMSNLGTNISSFVKGLRGEGESAGLTDDDINNTSKACEIMKLLANASKELEKTGGVKGFFSGNKDLGNFGEDIGTLGTNLSSFATSISGLANTKTDIDNAMALINNLKEISNVDISGLPDVLNKLKSSIPNFVKNINKIKDDNITKAINKVKLIVDYINGLTENDYNALNSILTTIESIGNNFVNKFVNSLTSETALGKVEKAVDTLLDSAINQLKKDDNTKKIKEAGKYFVEGFSIGITENKNGANSAASELGKKALEALQKSVKEKSPSKATYKIGEFFDEGLSNGISENARGVIQSSNKLGDDATNALNNSFNKINDLFGMEGLSDPVIKPILDLTDLERGAQNIDGMFNSPILNTNLSAISRGMSNKIQNGTANDVVSAINKLGTNLSGGNTYNINGISYDSDSNVANAIETLVHAITVERRI